MASSFQPDRFDDIPADLERVGAHRTPRKRGRGWIVLGVAAAMTAILITIGVVGILGLNGKLLDGSDGGSDAGSSAPPTDAAEAPVEEVPAVAPTVDPSLAVTVLNGTATAGLAASVGDILAAAGWNVTTRSNAATEDIVDSVVYYADPALEGAALGAAQSIPGATIALSDAFAEAGGAALVVVIGSNYVPAG